MMTFSGKCSLTVILASWLLMPLVCGEEESGDSYDEPELSDRDRRFWAFQPPVKNRTPDTPGAKVESPIDAFLIQKLRENGIEDLAPSAGADTLLRRLTFDLTGLPPSETQRSRFLSRWNQNEQRALREMIDELLASSAYGERWAQHWLDIARFAETDGFEHDKVRTEAWKYRDWVVKALNADLPYDRFVALQIAADEIEPENPDSAVATGFLLGGPDMPDINLESERRHNVLNEMTSAVGAAFLGITMECAQCHDHKSDPISQADFYRLRAVFDEFELPQKNKSLPVIFPVDSNRSEPARLFVRGDFRRPGLELEPGIPRVMAQPGDRTLLEQGRAELSNWLTRPAHPLTARVMVNRVWQHHFGAPLVATPSDFGKLGERPTHPELLDWLAIDFVENGWSLKSLHREILLSRAWQQASRLPEGEDEAGWELRLKSDAENTLLSRQRRQRLSGEAIRDAMLSISGRLNRKAGGPGVRPPLPPEVTATLLKNQWPVTADAREHDRRSIYLFARRNLRFPFFDVFDRPDPNQSCGRRYVSTTAPQSLTLFNDSFVHEMAAETAEPIVGSPDRQIATAYRKILGREASAEELSLAETFLQDQPIEQLCLALFNLSEFVYLD